MYSDQYPMTAGAYPTRTLGDIYAEPIDEREEAEGKIGVEYFKYHYNNCGLPNRLLTTSSFPEISNYGLETIYVLLMSRYGDSHIQSDNEELTKLRVNEIIFEYGPEWQRMMVIADRRLKLSDDALKTGSKQIHNHASNPGDEPGTDDPDYLPYIDDQNTSTYMGSDTDAYINYYMAVKQNATKDFLDKFKRLFIQICMSSGNTYYVEEL